MMPEAGRTLLRAHAQDDTRDATTPPRPRPKVNKNTLKRVRLAVYQRDGFRCRLCGWVPRVPKDYDGSYALAGEAEPATRKSRAYRILELDHILPYSRGGKFTVSNLQALCNVCNVRKGAKV